MRYFLFEEAGKGRGNSGTGPHGLNVGRQHFSVGAVFVFQATKNLVLTSPL